MDVAVIHQVRYGIIAEIEKDADLEERNSHRTATDTTTTTHNNIVVQDSSKPFPVDILLDAGLVKKSTNRVCT